MPADCSLILTTFCLFAVPFRTSMNPSATQLFLRLVWDARNLSTTTPYCLTDELNLVLSLETAVENVKKILRYVTMLSSSQPTLDAVMQAAVDAVQASETAEDAANLIPALRSAIRTLWGLHSGTEPSERVLAMKIQVWSFLHPG